MDAKKSLARLQRLCSKAEYCSSDIYRKALKDVEGDSEQANEILSSLLKDRYVDDSRYSSAFAREKASIQGWGTVKIRFALRSKGIADDVISAALEEIEPEAAGAKLQKVLAAKYKTLREDPECKLKLLRFALSRGYEYSVAGPAVEEVIRKEMVGP